MDSHEAAINIGNPMGNPFVGRAPARPVNRLPQFRSEIYRPISTDTENSFLERVKSHKLGVFVAGAVLSFSLGVSAHAVQAESPVIADTQEVAEPEAAPSPEPPKVDQLLGTIASVESTGNYNARLDSPDSNSPIFTDMAVGKVLKWQVDSLNSGLVRGTAVGRYQFINKTLNRIVNEYGIDRDALFDENMQDHLATILLIESGLHDYLEGRISARQFARNLCEVWAALPKVIGGSGGCHDSVAGNKALISQEGILSAIHTVK